MPLLHSLKLQSMQSAVYAALRAWGEQGGTEQNLLSGLLLVLLERAKLAETTPTGMRLATNNVLQTALAKLESGKPLFAQILTNRFLNNEIVMRVANELGLSEDQVKRRQRKAIAQLSKILIEMETAVRNQRRHEIETTLEPSTYRRLFAIDKKVVTLTEKLLASDNPWLAIITGIGGIGKTALADRVVRQLIAEFHFAEVIWLRVQQTFRGGSQSLPENAWDDVMGQLAQRLCPLLPANATTQQRNVQVRQALKARPFLVVIDNLETEEETAVFLTHLKDLAKPSKFLLTARTRPPGQIGIYTIALDELPRSEAVDFIRYHAGLINLKALAEADDAQLLPIYDGVGGNPLAIKLVVGLAQTLPLAHILRDLIQTQITDIEELYRNIYWKMWHSLTPQAQMLLEKMPMADSAGMLPAQMAAVSKLDDGQLHRAIHELVQRSLLEVRGTTFEPRYGIHRLTDSFLRTDIIHWPDDSL